VTDRPGAGSPIDGLIARLPGASAALDVVGRARSGPWRVEVGEASMRPALEPGDWLLVDPTIRIWPRRGSIVLVREPGSDLLVIKRVAARPGDIVRTRDGPIRLGPTRAWLLGDDLASSVDSRRYGPVPLDRLVGRAWFRYGPRERIARLDRT
jgi:signal peptidase I